MLRPLLVVLALAAPAAAQFVYDFDGLSGSDPHPFTLLHGQDGWSEQTFNAPNRLGVTATRSHDGSQSLRFQEVGPGFGTDASRINDASWFYPPLSGSETTAFFQADLQIGYWGGSFGLAHDTNGSGAIRGSEPGERGVRFVAGTQGNVQLKLVAADGQATTVPLANAGPISGGHWLRIRVVMDLAAGGGAGLGHVYVQNITQGGAELLAVPGLQGVPLGLDPMATDATNPALWDAMWLHFEGATYGLDNIEIGRAGYAQPYGQACSGAAGPAVLQATDTFLAGDAIQLFSGGHAPGRLGVLVLGFSDSQHQGQALPLLLDPLLGTSGCSLYASIDATLVAFTGSGSAAALSTPIQAPMAWTGWRIWAQHACFEPVAGGLSWSNGVVVQMP